MSNIIDSIQLSGVTYTLQGSGGGTVDTALDSGSTNPVQNQALYDELRITETEPDTVIVWSDGQSTNFPSGCTKIEVDATNIPVGLDRGVNFLGAGGLHDFLGDYEFENFSRSVRVTNGLDGSTYSVSGYVVTIEWNASVGVNSLMCSDTDGITVTAIGSNTTISLKQALSGKVDTSSVVSSVTSASTDSEIPTAKAVFDAIPTGSTSGNPTVELTQAEYDALVSAGTVSANTYYIITDATPIETSGFVQTSAITSSVTSASTDSQIPTAKAVWEAASGGGTTYTAGRGIDITNDTISVSLPISAGTGTNSVAEGNGTTANGNSSHAEGSYTTASGGRSHAEGYSTTASGLASHAEGRNTQASGDSSHAEGRATTASSYYSHAEGNYTSAMTEASHAEGNYTKTTNKYEHASGSYNNTVSASTTFGDSGNTLFSVGNGTADNARHNAFEIRQNGDIYLSSGGTDIKLQDHLGGGGSSINVVQTTGSSTTDVMSQDAVTTQLSGYVTTDTEQTISGRKIFTYSSNSAKAIEFKQTSDSAKVGFSIKNSASTNNEVASFEFRPNTFTIDGVQHPLMYFGHYRNNNTANAGVPQTVIGFRQYDQKNAAAYHYLMPLPEKAKTPFSLTTSFKDYYAPMGFKNGSTMITADNTGVADFSSVLGGLKLVKITQSAYDALTTKDDNTVYFIGDSTNGYTMKIGSANVN